MTAPASTLFKKLNGDAHRWKFFLVVTGLVHFAVIAGSPNIVVPPRISQQLDKVVWEEILFTLPFIWSVVVLFCYRTREERIVGYASLVVSLLWLAAGTETLGMMY